MTHAKAKAKNKTSVGRSRPSDRHTLGDGFVASCFGCEHQYDEFRLDSTHRFHEDADTKCSISTAWRPKEQGTLVSHVPDWKDSKLDISILPPLKRTRSDAHIDLFARWADRDKSGKHKEYPDPLHKITVKFNQAKLDGYLPYKKDHLSEQGWRCGSPICWRSERLQNWIWHPNVFVLDMSTYHWSQTLKDLRTWAIVNVALDKGFRHLAAWTAGNAGLSLAMLVRACNHFLQADQRVRTYALYDHGDESVRDVVIDTLKRWECVLIAVPDTEKKVFDPEEIKHKVKGKAVGLSGASRFDDEYLQVTDGWGVGMLMYRLLFAQVIRDIQPSHIVAPLGTGNLLLGVVLAARDCELAHLRKPVIIGAMPEGNNLLRQILAIQNPSALQSVPTNPPLMPKIANTYSPLKPCVDEARNREEIKPFEVSLRDQELAGDELIASATGRRIRCEPSSLAAFAVLPRLRKELKADRKEDTNECEERILVVNSGCGLLSTRERDFMQSRSG